MLLMTLTKFTRLNFITFVFIPIELDYRNTQTLFGIR